MIIDPRVHHVGISALRTMDFKNLPQTDIFVLRKGDESLAVIVPYNLYMRMQRAIAGEDRVNDEYYSPGNEPTKIAVGLVGIENINIEQGTTTVSDRPFDPKTNTVQIDMAGLSDIYRRRAESQDRCEARHSCGERCELDASHVEHDGTHVSDNHKWVNFSIVTAASVASAHRAADWLEPEIELTALALAAPDCDVRGILRGFAELVRNDCA